MPQRTWESLKWLSWIGMKKPKIKEDYIWDWRISRNDHVKRCEIEWCTDLICDIHHIMPSMRGRRKHKKDWSDLIGVCRKHHVRIHEHNKLPLRLELLERVAYLLVQYAINAYNSYLKANVNK